MGNRSGLYLWVDEALNGKLAEQLATWREEGLTYDQIAYELRDLGYVISRNTVHRWLNPAPEPEAATQ